jgi:hypothetical protein
MTKWFLPIGLIFLFNFSIIEKTTAQIFLGASIGAVDSSPSPNASVYGNAGYNIKFYSWSLKSTLGYYYTLFPTPENKPKTQFSGLLATIKPEFILTSDRENPFKANIGPAYFYGTYAFGKNASLFGISPGIAWGFEAGFTKLEITGDMNLLYATNKEGSSNGPLHLMAQMGVLVMLW